MAHPGMILICEVADAPVIMGISKPAGLESKHGEVKIMNPLFVGIDVSSKNNVTYLMKPDGSKHSSFSVQNNLDGAKLMSEKIVSALETMQLSDVVIGLEATSIYGDGLICALREDGRLGRYQRKIHVLNPKQVKKFKDSYPDLPKNDWVDAFVIADHLRFGRIGKEVYMDDYRYKALQTLTRARFDVIQNLTREKLRFANYLFLKCSGMAQDKDIQNTSATTIALMERFETTDDLANADLDELTAFIDEKGRNFADPATKAKAIRVAARDSYRLPITVNNSVNQAMAVSIASMRALEKQVKVLDKAIEQQFQIIPNTLTSIPGIGKVYSAGIIAEIGNVRRFNSQASVAKYAGLVWTQHQSGDFEAQHTKLIKSGNRYLRYYLLEAANSVRRCDSEFRRYYDLKFKEVNQFQHKRALALTARKLVRLVYRLLMDNRLYIPPEG
ncbi:MAG: IS110 family transposase [Oscillospiraceae bacterium]